MSLLTRRRFLQGQLALGALCAGAAVPLPTSAGTWRAGAGRAKVTPAGPVWMAGYGARTREGDATLQDLWVRALALVDPQGRTGVLLAIDNCGIGREVADTIAGEIRRRHGFGRDAVMIDLSHTHCSPFTEGLLGGMREFGAAEWRRVVAYTRWLEQQAVAAVDAAVSDLAPVTLSRGMGAAGFAVNRRNNREADVPRLRAENRLAGPVDHDVPVLAVRARGGGLKAVVFGYACHTTTLNLYEWNGDYAGFAAEELERRHRGATALFAAGCGADINPLPRRTVELARDYGRQLADAVDAALQTPVALTGGLTASFERISLEYSRVPARAELEAMLGREERELRYERLRARHLLGELDRRGAIDASYPYPIQCWRLGDLTWIALGGEPTVEYALRLKRELGPATWVMGYASEIMAYIPSERVLQEGGYEGGGSMAVFGRPAPWAPGLENKIVSTARRLVRSAGASIPLHTFRTPDERR
jgi:neutral ceramidase